MIVAGGLFALVIGAAFAILLSSVADLRHAAARPAVRGQPGGCRPA
jgi:hypothetical protein